jgi:hypothetical protein
MRHRKQKFSGNRDNIACGNHVIFECPFRLALAQIWIRDPCGVDHSIRLICAECAPNGVKIRQIGRGSSHRANRMFRTERLNQSRAKQTVRACDSNLHSSVLIRVFRVYLRQEVLVVRILKITGGLSFC